MENDFSKIALQSRNHKKVQTIMHYVNKENLAKEHKMQKSGKATGIDKVSKEQYAENLDENLENLIARMKTFSYRPQAVRRTYIPKTGSDKMRPLGIPAYEDKLVQGVMRKILDQIYEWKFYDFSYGFRQGRNCHMAVRDINQIVMTRKVNYVVDADIKGFFDNVDHKWLMKFLENDIQDKNFLRYIVRFLKSGIIEDMKYYESDKGTPQGGLISPVLANVYLHYVLDMWFDKVVKKRCKGEAYIVRYADDFVCFFQYENEAISFYQALKERLKKFNLELAEDKSKIMRFGRFAKQNSKDGKTESFDFLGFTFINGETLTGKYRIIYRTSKKKLKAKKQAVKEWLKMNIHGKPSNTIGMLNKKLIGHYAYYGISGNYQSLLNFYRFIVSAFYKALTRRSQRAYLSWKRYQSLLRKHPIVQPKLYVDIWT
ncbi:MAG: group II intron reverse transcriptase/maturase [Lachnospiraceae bacterium]|nr:group II intron reverse transcriptase/maturase [Lachnospiraceae bacterium]